MTRLSGACHCGSVRFELDHVPGSLTECNCSICRRYGALWAYYDRKTARINCSPGAVTSYSWGDRQLEFYFCNRCGCVTHYESVEKEPESRIAVNTRMLAAADVAGIEVKHFDGAVTWKYQDKPA
ncbi:MAG: GFA family protein [Xanthomonadales bacterium]|nr:GFA family protein [Gammaproteobacteria bacterium]MBT8053506.1 GFA family protein [Gammaproteobacteria bacterium]NND55874.1 GFA family protein [Xanthomonadales bacterium]